MENLTTTDFTWFIMLGICIGAFFELIFEDHGIGMTAHIIIGVISCVFGGLVFAVAGLVAHLVFATVCSTLVLFLLDMYYVAINLERNPKDNQTIKLK